MNAAALEIDSASPCIATAARAASRRLTQLYDEVMAPAGLRITQYHLLSELERRTAEPPTVGELATILTMERSALGQTLRPLERDGLVELRRDESDARRRPIVLTPAGEQAVATARPYWARAHGLFERHFGAEALADLRNILRGIAQDPDLPRAFGAGHGHAENNH
jgi:DNA-binding MarR family transcriptional regulator